MASIAGYWTRSGGMDAEYRIIAAGDSALLVEREERIDRTINSWIVGLASALQARAIAGVRDVVPAFRSLCVSYDPARTDVEGLRAAIVEHANDAVQPSTDSSQSVRIPVCYGGECGPDLIEVARWAGLDSDEVVRRHVEPTYQVFMIGFMPGFPYMGEVDSQIAMPRRLSPRVSVPAGSVGIAGRQTGIYPLNVPGGWQLIGRTPVSLFDVERRPPSLVRPGDAVRFEAMTEDEYRSARTRADVRVTVREDAASGQIEVVRPGMLTTIQDIGRWGWQAEGVSVSGPMDPWSLRAANALVGNDSTCAALEVTVFGPELRFDRECRIAVTGAAFDLTVDDAAAPTGRPFVVSRGGRLRFGRRLRGARAYVAVEGGIDVPQILGSRATHLRSRMGGHHGRALVAGDRLALGSGPRGIADRSAWSTRAYDAHEPRLQTDHSASNHARVRVLPGPQHDRFAADALDVLQSRPYTVTPASDRMGFRLDGPGLRHQRSADIISDPTPVGSVQVPGEGQPLLLMAERQTTGGYAKVATVIAADIGLAGQLAPGDSVTFEVCSMREAIAAVIARERALMMVGG